MSGNKFLRYALCAIFYVVSVAAQAVLVPDKFDQLHKALDSHEKNIIIKLLADFTPEELDTPSTNGFTVAHHVAVDGLTWVVPLLAKQGVNLNRKDTSGNSPLYYALHAKKPGLAQLFLDNGANARVSNKYGVTPLHEASLQADADAIKVLLQHAPDLLTSKDYAGRTPLFYAASSGNPQVVTLLLQAGADADARDLNGEDVAHVIASGGSLTLLELLIERGIPINKPDNHNEVPVHKALRYGFSPFVRKLVEHDLFLEQADALGKNALHWLVFFDNDDELLATLIEKYPDLVTKSNALGQTPLHIAAAFARSTTLEKLIKAGALVKVFDLYGFTPEEYALGYGNTVNAQLLKGQK